jgi:glycosyltransferase involved in cell wall biosynthesis
MKLISIVIPCYNSEATIRKVVEMVMEEFKKMDGYDCEFVLVNDGSPKDNTYGEIKKLGEQYQNVKGINLLRNFGQHNALMAALHYTEGDFILGMDDDMQTHPSQISKLIHKMEEGYDLVYGCYPKRKNSFLKNVTSKLNEVSSRILLGRPKDIVSSNFWMITRQIKDEVVKYDSFNPYIDGIFYRTTHKIGNVEVEHFKRAVGTSNYTLKKLIKLWLAYWNYSASHIVRSRRSFCSRRFSGSHHDCHPKAHQSDRDGWLVFYNLRHRCLFRIDSDGARHHRRIPRKDDSDSEPHAAVYCAGNH